MVLKRQTADGDGGDGDGDDDDDAAAADDDDDDDDDDSRATWAFLTLEFRLAMPPRLQVVLCRVRRANGAANK